MSDDISRAAARIARGDHEVRAQIRGPDEIADLAHAVNALASYLDARQHHGRWLVRMEDLDPPREEADAAERILRDARGWEKPSDHAPVFATFDV